MRKYHHLGIPTTVPREGEYYIEEFKTYILDYRSNPYGIEWMRYEPGAPLPDLVKTVPHIAFEVDDLRAELEGKEVLIQPNSPSEGVTVAFIVENGAPVEFLQYEKTTPDFSRNYRVVFDSLPWQSPMPGLRFKAVVQDGLRLRLVEYSKEMEPHWCDKGHRGMILDGEMEIRFEHQTLVYRSGDGVFIPSGGEHRHMGKTLTDVVRAVFVEEI